MITGHAPPILIGTLSIPTLFPCVLGAFVALSMGVAAPAIATPFDGKIVTSRKPIAMSSKSRGRYFAKLRAQWHKRFVENKQKKEWKLYFAAFFRRPLQDLEFQIRLYDVTGARPRLVDTYEQFLPQRGQKSVVSSIVLSRDTWGVNRQVKLVAVHKGRTLATGFIKIIGEPKRHKGKVDFTAPDPDDEPSEGKPRPQGPKLKGAFWFLLRSAHADISGG